MNNEELQQLTERLGKEGKLIEAGWACFRTEVLGPQAPHRQVEETRLAFMCGATYVFFSWLNLLEPDGDPSEPDRQRIDQIHEELLAFQDYVMRRAQEEEGEGPTG